MQSIAALHASDESSNASVATVQTIRSPLASTLAVDTVEGIPDDFFGSMGTPHTFIDPITSEEITVISDATAVDFAGHVDGGNLEIDTIAPGYTDNGSAVGDIVIIRPTTQYADNLADALAESHEDDGALKGSALAGWFPADELWTYSAWTSGTQIGVIDVPSDGTTKYAVRNRIKITQATGGTKYGIIVAVSATTITVFFPTGVTFTNETITNPSFSPLDSPIGFNPDPLQWTLQTTDTTERIVGSPAQGTWYNPGSISLPLGIGAWDCEYFVQGGCSAGSASRVDTSVTLSNANNSANDADLIATFGGSALTYFSHQFTRRKTITLTSAGTLYLLGRADQPSMTNLYFENQASIGSSAIIRAKCAYL